MTHALGGVQRQNLRERRHVSTKLSNLLPRPGETANPTQAAVAEFHSACALDALVYFHITSPWVMPAAPGQDDPIGPPLQLAPDPRDIARLRTDLDGFGETEIAALVNHGYDITDRYVRRYAPALVRESLNGQPAPAPVRPQSDVAPEWAHRMLTVGSERFFRALRLGSVMSWAGTFIAATVLIGAVWMSGVTIYRMFEAAASLVRAEIALFDWVMRPFVPVRLGPASRAPVVLLLLLVVAVAWVLRTVSRTPHEQARPRRPGWGLNWRRTLNWALEYVRAAKGNWLWGLLGLPMILALAMSAVALFSYVFFHLPYMRATRLARARPAA